MCRIAFLVPILPLVLSLVICHHTPAAVVEQAEAIAKIEKWGGRVVIDEKSPGRPVISVRLNETRITDDGLQCLKGLTQLRKLDLDDTKITDAGLAPLKGLTQLPRLDLENTQITDAGLEYLKGMTQLEQLDLDGTKVTDAGLVRHPQSLCR